MTRGEGKVAVVTGASSGIGRATALRLAERGAVVVATARRADRLAELRQSSAAIEPFAADVTDDAALTRCVEQTVQRHGRIDILVNNAGFSFYERHAASTFEQWRATMAVNLDAMYALTKRVTPHMIQQRYGRIVNVSSVQALASEPNVGAYAASKGAINAWSRCLAVDLAEFGILVNVVAPGCIRTEMSVIDGKDETQSELFQQWYVAQRKIPLARPGEAGEVADAIMLLCGDECTYITGHTLVVDGGLTATF
ncbi:MAG: SDR family NAD(P)-dependent oxidoreductase [bacterium]